MCNSTQGTSSCSNCTDGWTPSDCQEEVNRTEAKSPIKIWVDVGSVLGTVVVLVVAVVVMSYITRRFQRRAISDKKSYSSDTTVATEVIPQSVRVDQPKETRLSGPADREESTELKTISTGDVYTDVDTGTVAGHYGKLELHLNTEDYSESTHL